MRRSIACASVLLVMLLVVMPFATPAIADPDTSVALFGALPNPILTGTFASGHGSAAGVPHGWFLAAEAGVAWRVGASDVAARSTDTPHDRSWTFGARAGYQLASGLAVQARFDRLGVTAADASGRLSAAAAGVRYSAPLFPLPFAEVLVGAAFHAGDQAPVAALGIGGSIPLTRHAQIDVSLRDWLVDISGVHHIPTATVGITAGFGG
jgi:hypothetical protein